MRQSSRLPLPRLRPLSISLARLGSVLAVAAALSRGAHAANLSWDPAGNQTNSGGTGAWNLSSLFWNDGAAPNESWPNVVDSVAVFGGTGGVVTIDTDAGALTGVGVNANGLVFNAGNYTIAGGDAAEVLTLAGATPTITVTNASDLATISTVVAGSAGMVKAGAGTLVLAGVNTFAGNVGINAGTLSVSLDENLGAAVNGVSLANGAVLSASGSFVSGRVLTVGAGGGSVDVTPGNTLNFTAALAGTTDALFKTGAGTLTLDAASTRAGNTVVTGGTLTLANVAAAGTGDILVQGGALQSAHAAANQNFVANVSLDGGAFIHNPGIGAQLNFAAGKSITIGSGGGHDRSFSQRRGGLEDSSHREPIERRRRADEDGLRSAPVERGEHGFQRLRGNQ